ncbi:defensin Ec-AMP-D2-like [Pyrus ussuriensis x Pyrus communis]|uniref:Defensin Ec-AMP-D2-like n=1 Tax=Pyrus ussuriensis x Pyrus communis TaxID=2448454 RepID=A0A5N5FUM8_9ROSA|nr:defensin Ec-AMP-D2-like [Pyrus ussuriensis x Pyrus communis]
MERSTRLVSAAFVLVLLLAATVSSNRFHGTCASKSNCAVVCQTMGFLGGWCLGLRRRCFCTLNC